VATEHHSTLVFPILMDVLDAVREQIDDGHARILTRAPVSEKRLGRRATIRGERGCRDRSERF